MFLFCDQILFLKLKYILKYETVGLQSLASEVAMWQREKTGQLQDLVGMTSGSWHSPPPPQQRNKKQ